MPGMIYTEKFAEKIDERYTPSTVSHYGTNKDYDFVGAKTIKISSVNTADMGDYSRTAGFGEAQQLENTIQELTMTKDRAFKIVLDKMDEEETKIKAGEVLARQKREVIDPELEDYRLAIMGDIATANGVIAGSTKAYENFLKAQEKLDDAFVPLTGRVAFCSPAFLNKIKLDANFIKASEMAQDMLVKGQVGEIDGIRIMKANKAWLKDNKTTTKTVEGEEVIESTPTLFDCLLVHKSATVAPVKLAEYKIIKDSEQYSGTLFLGRVYYDCFVLNNKKAGIVGITRV